MHSFATKTVGHRRLLGAGLIAFATLAGTTTTCQAQNLGTSGYGQTMPRPVPAQAPPAPASTTVSSSTASEKADFTIQIGETFSLRQDEGGLIKDVLASRPGIVQVEVDKDNPSIARIKGVNVGVTQLTLSARDKDNKNLAPIIKTIQVNPDISYIRSKVAETFPTSNLKIIAGGPPGSLIVTGTVESVEDVDPIYTFIDGIAAQYGGRQGGGGQQNKLVTYAIRVSGPQVVQLDVCLASVDRRELRQLGVDSFQRSGTNFLGTSIGGAGTTSINSADGIGTVASTNANFVFRSSQGANAFIGFIHALREESVGKIMSNPSLTALSGRPARFIVGGEEPYGTSGSANAGGGGSGIQFRPTGTVVSFLPVVLGEGRIRLTVSAENTVKTGDSNQAGIIAPILATQSVGTTLELENGQSLVIGGLTENTTTGTSQKYPILGDLPFVGTLFRNVSFTEREQEFVILVKVNIVESLTDAARCGLKLPGQETRSPSDFELFIEGILEAPRGPRDIFPNRTYVPAFKNDVPYGAKSGECALPGPLCNDKFHHHGSNCATGNCGTGCTTGSGYVVPAQSGQPAAQLPVQIAPAGVVPTTVPEAPVSQTSQTVPAELKPVEKVEVPVVSVPVVPATETPKQTDLPVPPAPPVPQTDPK